MGFGAVRRLWSVVLVAVTAWLVGIAAPALAAGGLVVAPSQCDAVVGNLVANCGFETGDTSGWTERLAAESSLLRVDGSGDEPHSGADYLSFGSPGSHDDAVAQTLTSTVPGATYAVSFWVGNNAEAAQPDFFATVEGTADGDVTLLSLPTSTAMPFTRFEGTFVAGGSAPAVVFSGRHDNGWMDLDDVVVMQQSGPPDPPMPPAPPVAQSPSVVMQVTSSANPAPPGAPVTFIATVSPAPTCGSVTWFLDSASATSVPAGDSGGSYPLGPITSLTLGDHSVTAVYSGCAALASTGAALVQRIDPQAATASPEATVTPSILARVTSAHPKRNGWYRAAVHVSFSCQPGSAPLVAPCPDPLTLGSGGAGQQLTGAVTAVDGARASVTVTVSIDRDPPTLTVTRIGRRLTCQATDDLSGLDRCRITRSARTRAGVRTVRWTATARDVAGNRAVKRGSFQSAVG